MTPWMAELLCPVYLTITLLAENKIVGWYVKLHTKRLVRVYARVWRLSDVWLLRMKSQQIFMAILSKVLWKWFQPVGSFSLEQRSYRVGYECVSGGIEASTVFILNLGGTQCRGSCVTVNISVCVGLWFATYLMVLSLWVRPDCCIFVWWGFNIWTAIARPV